MSKYGTAKLGDGRTTEVARGGEEILAMTEDGRSIKVSRKLAETFPERYTVVEPPVGSAKRTGR